MKDSERTIRLCSCASGYCLIHGFDGQQQMPSSPIAKPRDPDPNETLDEYAEYIGAFLERLKYKIQCEAVKDDLHLHDFEPAVVIARKHNMLVDEVLALKKEKP